MCGLTGAITLDGRALDPLRLKSMADLIAHRGPDDSGFLLWQSGRLHQKRGSYGQAFCEIQFAHLSPLLPAIDSPAGEHKLQHDEWDIYLAHRRLSILDLSPRGHQPMSDRGGQRWVAYNGEIYNFRELRSELSSLGYAFISNSDTEVLLHAYAEWGPDCVSRFNGMFAFALWDAHTSTFLLARDRYGIKPLYYRIDNGTLVFGSEIKSILAYFPGRLGVDLLALNEYFSFQNMLSDRTLFGSVRILRPGQIMAVRLDSGTVDTCSYWDFNFHSADLRPTGEIADDLAGLIEQAVRRQCVADVPLGSYLSGGMDSCTVSALASQLFGRITSFTAGFDLSEAASHEMMFDERAMAEHMASTLQTEHYECVLHSGDLEALIDGLVWHLEDLRIGQSYPNSMVARLASKFVKVVLSGIGGDELFGGYPWRYSAALGEDGSDYISNYYDYWQRLVPDDEKNDLFSADIRDQIRSQLGGGANALADHTREVFASVFPPGPGPQDKTDKVNSALYFECKTFLHGLLVVEDKLSMAHSLETRVPFLDNDVVDFACRIPIWHKLADLAHLAPLDENLPRKKNFYEQLTPGTGKTILRSAMDRILPPQIVSARKQGFSAPDESWFRGRSELFVRERLLGSSSRLQTYFNPNYLRRVLDQHTSGGSNKRLLIWSLLCFESWLRSFDPA